MCSVVASLTGKMAAQVLLTVLMEQQTVTNPAVILDLGAMTKTLHQQCMLAQARPPMMNYFTSTVSTYNVHGQSVDRVKFDYE